MRASRLTVVILLSAGAGGVGCGRSSSEEFTAVQAIFDRYCDGCHDANARVSGSYPELPLTPGRSHATLVGKPAHETCGGTLVAPGDASGSYLLAKVTENPPCEGKRMPTAEGGLLNPLSQVETDAIAAWISAGAPD
jgi:hypothetical protein